MYAEHSFPGSNWMGGWKATGLVLALGIVWSTLWASTLLLSRCTALGPIHRRFVQLAPGQQRNVAVYVTHLLLDTLVLAYVSRPMLELWSGAIETTAAVRTGMVGFTYIVACYALELTWRRRCVARRGCWRCAAARLFAGGLAVGGAQRAQPLTQLTLAPLTPV
jgi:hypothetical protein